MDDPFKELLLSCSLRDMVWIQDAAGRRPQMMSAFLQINFTAQTLDFITPIYENVKIINQEGTSI